MKVSVTPPHFSTQETIAKGLGHNLPGLFPFGSAGPQSLIYNPDVHKALKPKKLV